jgi:hypothetical protein
MKSKSGRLERFLAPAQLDPLLFAGRSLYLVPDGPAASQGPALPLCQRRAEDAIARLGAAVMQVQRARQQEEAARQAEMEARQQAEEAQEQARRNLYARLVEQAAAERQTE